MTHIHTLRTPLYWGTTVSDHSPVTSLMFLPPPPSATRSHFMPLVTFKGPKVTQES